MNKMKLSFGALLLSFTTVGCLGPTGPHIHVASATKADLVAAKDADTVWYEFKPGDEVPFQFLFIGVAMTEGPPLTLIAKEHFWLVMSENHPMQISYDGKTATHKQTELVIAVVPGDDGKAQVLWLNHLGEGSAEEELAKLSGSSSE